MKSIYKIILLLFFIQISIESIAQDNSKTNNNSEIVIVPIYNNIRITVTVLTGLNTSADAERITNELKELKLFEEIFVSLERKQVELKIGGGSFGIAKPEIKKIFLLRKCTIDSNILEKPEH